MIKLHRRFGDFEPFLKKHKQFETAIEELIQFHQKRTCWIWFLLPNLKKDGQSYYANYFGLYDKKEAILFYQNNVLKTRLFQLLEIIHDKQQTYSTKYIMNGYVDMVKLKSCIDLFYDVTTDDKEKLLLTKMITQCNKDFF